MEQIETQCALDEHFTRLLALASRRYLTLDDLMNERLPSSMSFRETWEALTAIRRAGAIEVPFREVEGFDSWYAPTFHISQTLRRLERQCSADSALARYVSQAKSSDIYAENLADEIIGIATHDNVKLDRDRTIRFLTMRYAPRNDSERLLRNIYTLMESLEEYRDEPFSVELTERIYQRIINGVDMAQLDLTPESDQLETASSRTHWATEKDHLDAMFAYANGKIGDPFDPPLIRAAFLRTFFSFHQPWPSMNQTLGRFLFGLICLKNDLPFACTVPYSNKLLHWLEATRQHTPGASTNGVATLCGSLPCAIDDKARSADYTAWVALALDLLEDAVNEVAQTIQQQQDDNRLMESMLSGTFMVNHRQRALLSQALRNPHETFLIRQHRIDAQIAYATARNDFLELAQAGFFVQAKEGKRLVFRPSPDLPEKLRSMAQVLEA